jgi:hypothetical protein
MHQERVNEILEANDVHDEKLAKALCQLLDEFATNRQAIDDIDKRLNRILSERNHDTH